MAKELQLAQEKVKELKIKIGKTKQNIIKKEKLSPKVKKDTTLNISKKTKFVKRNLTYDMGKTSLKTTKNVVINAPSTSRQPDVIIEVQQDEWYCLLCESCNVENMIQCISCKIWFHESCAGVKSGPVKFVCVNCK